MLDLNKMTIPEIIESLNWENGSNFKMNQLKLFIGSPQEEILKKVLKMTYDKVTYTFGITLKNIPVILNDQGKIQLEEALNLLEKLADRTYTGNAAIQFLTNVLNSLDEVDSQLIKGIINRDLRINIGRTGINKVFKNLIVKPVYMRCSLMDKIEKIHYPAIINEKLDGTYRSVVVDENISIMSRTGEVDIFPIFQEAFKDLPKGVYIGELLIRSLPGTKNRMKANGLINSDEEQQDMYIVLWDYLTLKEWKLGKSKVPYIQRFKNIQENDKIDIVKHKIVNNYQEARDFYDEIVALGGEGAVLKNINAIFKDGTSQENIKMKEEAVAEFIVTGFQEGNGRLNNTLGAMYYLSSDGLVEGKMGGFSDEIRDEIWNNQDKYLNSIVSVKYNGISKARDKSSYALMYATFEEFRNDKEQADDYKYIKNALK